jgi:hypothetical protein
MADVPEQGFRKYWRQKLSLHKAQCHDIKNKYPEAASVAQQVYKVLSDIEILARFTPARVGQSSDWKTIVNSAEENRANFCKAADGKPLFSAPYGMYIVTPNELKAVLKMSAQEGQSGAVNKTSVESTAQDDDFQEIKRRKRHIYNATSQIAKK